LEVPRLILIGVRGPLFVRGSLQNLFDAVREIPAGRQDEIRLSRHVARLSQAANDDFHEAGCSGAGAASILTSMSRSALAMRSFVAHLSSKNWSCSRGS
jgi:hypothetical protein